MEIQKAGTAPTLWFVGRFGGLMAMIMSFDSNHSVGWALLHYFCSWFYVFYRIGRGNY
jgi:hypothetical protein